MDPLSSIARVRGWITPPCISYVQGSGMSVRGPNRASTITAPLAERLAAQVSCAHVHVGSMLPGRAFLTVADRCRSGPHRKGNCDFLAS